MNAASPGESLRLALRSARSVLLTGPIFPDGDSIGACLALARAVSSRRGDGERTALEFLAGPGDLPAVAHGDPVYEDPFTLFTRARDWIESAERFRELHRFTFDEPVSPEAEIALASLVAGTVVYGASLAHAGGGAGWIHGATRPSWLGLLPVAWGFAAAALVLALPVGNRSALREQPAAT